MEVDLTKLITAQSTKLDVKTNIIIEKEYLEKNNINELKETTFIGHIEKIYNEYNIKGTISGTMILKDDITRENVNYDFNIDIDEIFNEYPNEDNHLQIKGNHLDITEFIWQNILLEIPSKIINEKNKNLKLEGNGWRLITESEINSNKVSPFAELKEKLK